MNNNHIQVSIVIPTYNNSPLLMKAIKSVLDQDYQYWELIIVDNNSTDDTIDVIESFNDERIRYILIQNNGVIAKSRNIGIINAAGEYIAFLDSDDAWSKNKLSLCVKCLQEDPSIDIICHDEYMVDEAGSILKYLNHGTSLDDAYGRLLLVGNVLSTSAVMLHLSKSMSKEIILFDESDNYVGVEDYELWLRLASANKKIHFMHHALGQYTIHGSNESKNIHRHYSNLKKVIQSHCSSLHGSDRCARSMLSAALCRVNIAMYKSKINLGQDVVMNFLRIVFSVLSPKFALFVFYVIKLVLFKRLSLKA